MDWLVVRTKPNKENTVKHLLSKHGVDVLIPMERIRKNNKVVSKKLMPGYIFVSKSTEAVFDIIKGISSILSCDYNQKPLKTKEIEALIPSNERPVTELESIGAKKGDILNITDGPMQGYSGTLEKIETNKSMAVVNVLIFNRTTSVKVSTEFLELAR